MIKHPENMTFNDKKFSMILYGAPGVGKTTLALSAPNPVLIDFDDGVGRVKAYHRKPTIVCENYEEVLNDIKSAEVRDCQTVIIDTGGSFISFLKDWAMRTKPGAVTKSGEFNSLKGFGFVKSEFASFTSTLRDVMKKNVIYIFHSVEQSNKDGNPTQRLMCEGASKNTVWTSCDFGGYVQMIDGKRMICFTPQQEYFAKGCHGVEGMIQVPTLTQDKPNDFITRLFDKARSNIENDNQAFAPIREQYEQVMMKVRSMIDGIKDIDTANAAAKAIPALEHALTSKAEASTLLKAKAAELGYSWSTKDGGYIENKNVGSENA